MIKKNIFVFFFFKKLVMLNSVTDGCQGIACGSRGTVRGSQGVAGGSGSSWVVAKVMQVVTRGILGGYQIVIKLFLLDWVSPYMDICGGIPKCI